MYSRQICAPYDRSVFHLGNEHLLNDARDTVKQLFIDKLTQLHIPLDNIRSIDAHVDTIVSSGCLPPLIGCHSPVVNHTATDAQLFPYHPTVQAKIIQLTSETKSFYIFTMNEEWWNGSPFFYVNDAVSYLQFLYYYESKQNEEVRDYIAKGKPKKDSSRYKQWIADCIAHKQAIHDQTVELKELESRIKITLAALELEKQELIAPVQAAKSKLTALRLQGAPKWVPD